MKSLFATILFLCVSINCFSQIKKSKAYDLNAVNALDKGIYKKAKVHKTEMIGFQFSKEGKIIDTVAIFTSTYDKLGRQIDNTTFHKRNGNMRSESHYNAKDFEDTTKFYFSDGWMKQPVLSSIAAIEYDEVGNIMKIVEDRVKYNKKRTEFHVYDFDKQGRVVTQKVEYLEEKANTISHYKYSKDGLEISETLFNDGKERNYITIVKFNNFNQETLISRISEKDTITNIYERDTKGNIIKELKIHNNDTSEIINSYYKNNLLTTQESKGKNQLHTIHFKYYPNGLMKEREVFVIENEKPVLVNRAIWNYTYHK